MELRIQQEQIAAENQIKALQTKNSDPKLLENQIKALQSEIQQKQLAAENQIEELKLEIEQKQIAAEKIYVESVVNLEGPINKAAYLDILKRSKVKYQLYKSNPNYSGLFNNNSFPQELLLYWDAN